MSNYDRPYCKSCKLILGIGKLGKIFNCTRCGKSLILKSFNPWVKLVIGLTIIGVCVLTGILGIWIGGFIWGASIIGNGFQQWFKIKKLDKIVDINELKEIISKKSDLELGKMFSTEREDYVKEAIEIAEEELKKRNIIKVELQVRGISSIDEALGTNNQKIIEELKKACEQIGFIDVEESFWIVIPKNPEEEAVWLDAVESGRDNEFLSSVRLPGTATCRPSEEKIKELVTIFNQALRVLHIHNHPFNEGETDSGRPSEADIYAAAYWKSITTGLANKMKFFIIQGNKVVEYCGIEVIEREINL